MSTPRLVLVTGHGAPVYDLAFSPDGTTLATCGRDRVVLLWDVPSGTLRAHLEGHPTGVRAVAFSPDGSLLATADFHEQVRMWDTRTGKWLAALPGLTAPIAFTSAPGRLVARNGDALVLIDHESGEVLRTLCDSLSWGLTAALAPDATTAADLAREQERELIIWELPAGEKRLHLQLPDDYEISEAEARAEGLLFRKFQVDVDCLALSPQGRKLAAGGHSTLWLCDAESGEPRPLSGCGYRGTHSLAFSCDAQWLAAGGADGAIRIWAVGSGAKKLQFREHDGWVSAVTFSPDGRLIASGGHDMAAALLDAHTGECFRPLHGRQYAVRSLAFSPGGDMLAAGQEDGTIRCWCTRTGRLRRTLEAREPWVSALAFSPAGSRLFAASSNGYHLDCGVESWSAGTSEPGPLLDLEPGHVDSLVAMPTAGTVAVSHRSWREQRRQCKTLVWDPETSQVWYDVEGAAAAASADGCLLATTFGTSSVATIRLWDARCGEVIRDLQPPQKPDSYDSLCFSPDGRLLAVGFDGCRVGLWDVTSGAQVWEGRTERDALGAVAYSPDGTTIAFGGSYDEQVVLWDAASGIERREFAGHTHDIHSLAFSPDGLHLASASADGSVKIWCPTKGELVATLRVVQPADNEAPEEWLAFTPAGHYVSSEGVEEFIRWKVGDELLPADTYRTQFRQPARVVDALRRAQSGA
jgi:WD40 repeat protein